MTALSSAYADDLIARLETGLDPSDREPFREAAESALLALGPALGEGAAYRAVAPIWRSYFHPPQVCDDPRTGGQSRLVRDGKQDIRRTKRRGRDGQ